MRAILCSLAVVLAIPARGEDRPACIPPGAVPVNPESPMDGWLSKAGADEVRKHLGKRVNGGTWDGDTLTMMCGIQGPARRMKVATVSSSGQPLHGVPGAVTPSSSRVLLDLARRTGHTKQEADVLGRRYAQLSKAFFRTVRDEDGALVSEGEVILRKHKRRAGLNEDGEVAGGGDEELSEQQAQDLEERMAAAEERNDMQEMLRLAEEARKAAASATARARKAGADTEKRTWQAWETAAPELAEAAYPTLILFGACPCVPCDVPELPPR